MFKSYEDVMAFGKANVEAAILAGNKLTAGVEEVTKEIVGYTTKSVETAMENATAMSGCKTVGEVAQVHQKVAKESWEAFVAESTKLSEMGTIIAKSAAEPIQSRYKVAFESFGA